MLRKFLNDQDGTATIEFVLWFPTIMTLFLMAFEVGLLMTRGAMLDRALDMSIRDIRISNGQGYTQASVKTDICNNLAVYSGCDTDLLVEMVKVDPETGNFWTNGATCVDRTSEIIPTVTLDPGQPSDIMFIRACLVVTPLFPTTGLATHMKLDASGGFQLVAYSALAVEP